MCGIIFRTFFYRIFFFHLAKKINLQMLSFSKTAYFLLQFFATSYEFRCLNLWLFVAEKEKSISFYLQLSYELYNIKRSNLLQFYLIST